MSKSKFSFFMNFFNYKDVRIESYRSQGYDVDNPTLDEGGKTYSVPHLTNPGLFLKVKKRNWELIFMLSQ